MGNEILLALAGNPNAGKTTLFNSMTGARETVGNRPGVTVEVRERRLRGGSATLADLPGVYSLIADSVEERVAADYIRAVKPDVLINIVDATNLERNLYLTTQLLELNLPVIVALNMMDEAQSQGIKIDVPQLSGMLGVPVLPICARTGEGVPALVSLCLRFANPPRSRHAPGRSAEARYRDAAQIRARCVRQKPRGRTRSDRIDAVLSAGWLSVPVFILIMGLVFYLTFDSLGAWLTQGVELLLLWCVDAARAGLTGLRIPEWLVSLACDGVLSGVGGVLAFLPQIALLFLFLSLLEDSGYMARTAFLSDPLLRRFGLSGRSFIPLMMGFGCTVPAVMAARTLNDRRDRVMTILLLPFMSCSAKLPVYGILSASIFPSRRGAAVLSLYLLGILTALLFGALLKKTAFASHKSHFVTELPPYRMPRLKNTLLYAAERVQHFLQKAGTVILLMSIALWACGRFDPALAAANSPENSILGRLGGLFAPVLRPLGFGDWRAAVALLTGLVAKEAVVSSMTLLCGTAGGIAELFTPASGYAFLVFVLLYTPCTAALATMKRELGSGRRVILSAACQTAIAYLAAFAAYRILSFLTESSAL